MYLFCMLDDLCRYRHVDVCKIKGKVKSNKKGFCKYLEIKEKIESSEKEKEKEEWDKNETDYQAKLAICHCPISLKYIATMKKLNKGELDHIKKEQKAGKRLERIEEENEND